MVTAVFGGVLHNEVNCLICGTESKKFDPFLGEIFPLVFPICSFKMLLVSDISVLQTSPWTFPVSSE